VLDHRDVLPAGREVEGGGEAKGPAEEWGMTGAP
jgi:hypothetical protein